MATKGRPRKPKEKIVDAPVQFEKDGEHGLTEMQSSFVSDNDSNENGNHLRTVYENCGLRNEFESDLRRKEHYLNSSVNKV